MGIIIQDNGNKGLEMVQEGCSNLMDLFIKDNGFKEEFKALEGYDQQMEIYIKEIFQMD